MPPPSAATSAPALPTTRTAGSPPSETRARVWPYGVCARVVSASPGTNPVASRAMVLPAVAVSAARVVCALVARVVRVVVPKRLIRRSVASNDDQIRRTEYLTVWISPSIFALRAHHAPRSYVAGSSRFGIVTHSPTNRLRRDETIVPPPYIPSGPSRARDARGARARRCIASRPRTVAYRRLTAMVRELRLALGEDARNAAPVSPSWRAWVDVRGPHMPRDDGR